MANLFKIKLPPERDGYTIDFASPVVMNVLDGGKPRSRSDFVGKVSSLALKWKTNSKGYDYLLAFYRTATAFGSLPFLIDLIFERSKLTEYTVQFVPDTFKLASQSGDSYEVVASVFITPLPTVEAEDLVLLGSINEQLQ
jgi:hypothetical protein